MGNKYIPFTFPEYLDSLTEESKAQTSIVEVDSLDAIEWYFAEMTGGRDYERNLQALESTDDPTALSLENIANIRNVSGRGWSDESAVSLAGCQIVSLQKIPVGADLFATNVFDREVANAVWEVTRHRGFEIANATKLLHQKRRSLIPILDSFARQALNVPWNEDWSFEGYRSVVSAALWNIREVAQHNVDSLNAIEAHLTEHPQLTSGLRLTRLRIIDVLAWSAVRLSNDEL